jgi:hypothetical protein
MDEINPKKKGSFWPLLFFALSLLSLAGVVFNPSDTMWLPVFFWFCIGSISLVLLIQRSKR